MKTEIKHHKVKRKYVRKAKPQVDIDTMIASLEATIKMLRALK